MKATLILSIFCLLAVSANVQAQGNKPPKGDSDVSAVSIIDDSVTGVGIGSDGRGAYLNGVDSVESIIQGIGDWELDARLAPNVSRSVFISFGDPVVLGDATAPFLSSVTHTRFISKCTQLGFKVRDMTVGQTRTCPLATSFESNGYTYRIAMNPATFATSDWVQWTCLGSASDGRCNSWVMEPSMTYGTERKAKGQLVRVGTSRKNPEVALGVFYFAFRIYVTI